MRVRSECRVVSVNTRQKFALKAASTSGHLKASIPQTLSVVRQWDKAYSFYGNDPSDTVSRTTAGQSIQFLWERSFRHCQSYDSGTKHTVAMGMIHQTQSVILQWDKAYSCYGNDPSDTVSRTTVRQSIQCLSKQSLRL